VILSIAAVIFNVVMLLLMALAVIGMLHEPAAKPARHVVVPSASVVRTVHTAGLVLVGFLITGFGLNIFAIGFGARLPIRKRASVASIASEFG
jgi:hypothetical protein